MGNYKTGHVSLLLKEIPPFLSYHEEVREDDWFGKESRIVSNFTAEYRFVQCELILLSPHYLWFNGERLKTSNEWYHCSEPNVIGVVELKCSSKDAECKDEILKAIEDYKKYLIPNHPNVIGEFCDEDGYDVYNFAIALDEIGFESEQEVKRNTVCHDCDKFRKNIKCVNYGICESAYIRGINSVK